MTSSNKMTSKPQTIKQFANPQEIADAGQKIYDTKFRANYESKYAGQFVAIDVTSEQAFVAQQPEEAFKQAQEASPKGIFHLIKVGSSGAFRVSYNSHASSDWLFR